MGVGQTRPISLAERNESPPKRGQGETLSAGFPPGPFPKRPEGRGCGPFLWNPSPWSGSGARGKAFRQAPWNLKRRDSLRHKRGWRGALQRTWMKLGKSAESWLSAAASPNLPGRASLDEKRFSFGPCTACQGEPRSGEKALWRVFFGKTNGVPAKTQRSGFRGERRKKRSGTNPAI